MRVIRRELVLIDLWFSDLFDSAQLRRGNDWRHVRAPRILRK